VSRNCYAEINLHLTWHTKGSSPLLVPKVEAEVHYYLRGRCINTPGV
jgi:putative transposase